MRAFPGNDRRLPISWLASCALFAILGHMFPVWLRFRGGKGVATALGCFLRFWFRAPSWVRLYLRNRGPLLAPRLAGIDRRRRELSGIRLAPVCAMASIRTFSRLIPITVASALVIARHHDNIRRLLSGTEPRFALEAQMSNIAIIGGGAWGTGLAIVLGRKGTHRVRLWAHEVDVCQSINEKRVNEKFLAGRQIPQAVSASNDLATVLEDAQIVVSVMPSQHCRNLFERMRPLIQSQALVVSATKGLEEASLLRMSEVIAEVLQQNATASAR